MGKLLSMVGASQDKRSSASWCIPALTKKGGLDTPIVLLVVTSDGPRYVPLNVKAPASIRRLHGTYHEIAMTDADCTLQEELMAWAALSKRLDCHNAAVKVELIGLASNVAAAARFLNVEPWPLEKSAQPLLMADLYLGRSISVTNSVTSRKHEAWIVSDTEDEFDLVVKTTSGSYCRIAASLDEISENGSGAIALGHRE